MMNSILAKVDGYEDIYIIKPLMEAQKEYMDRLPIFLRAREDITPRVMLDSRDLSEATGWTVTFRRWISERLQRVEKVEPGSTYTFTVKGKKHGPNRTDTYIDLSIAIGIVKDYVSEYPDSSIFPILLEYLEESANMVNDLLDDISVSWDASSSDVIGSPFENSSLKYHSRVISDYREEDEEPYEEESEEKEEEIEEIEITADSLLNNALHSAGDPASSLLRNIAEILAESLASTMNTDILQLSKKVEKLTSSNEELQEKVKLLELENTKLRRYEDAIRSVQYSIWGNDSKSMPMQPDKKEEVP